MDGCIPRDLGCTRYLSRRPAFDRFLRPVCYQNYPDEYLPETLKNPIPLALKRLANGKRSRVPLSWHRTRASACLRGP